MFQSYCYCPLACWIIANCFDMFQIARNLYHLTFPNPIENGLDQTIFCVSNKPLCSKIDNFRSLTHWGRVTHTCVGNLTITGSDNGLSPGRRRAIIWTNAGILLIGTLGTNFSEILSEIHTFSFKKMHFKMSSGKWWPFCLGLNVLTQRLVANLDLYRKP